VPLKGLQVTIAGLLFWPVIDPPWTQNGALVDRYAAADHCGAADRYAAVDRCAAVDRYAAADRCAAVDRYAAADLCGALDRNAAADRCAALDRYAAEDHCVAMDRYAAADHTEASDSHCAVARYGLCSPLARVAHHVPAWKADRWENYLLSLGESLESELAVRCRAYLEHVQPAPLEWACRCAEWYSRLLPDDRLRPDSY
jgi:hypothetical protein